MGAGHPEAKALRAAPPPGAQAQAQARASGEGRGEAAEASVLQSPVPFPASFPLLASFPSVQRFSNSSYSAAPAEPSPARTPKFKSSVHS